MFYFTRFYWPDTRYVASAGAILRQIGALWVALNGECPLPSHYI